jgi:hypothetical protein
MANTWQIELPMEDERTYNDPTPMGMFEFWIETHRTKTVYQKAHMLITLAFLNDYFNWSSSLEGRRTPDRILKSFLYPLFNFGRYFQHIQKMDSHMESSEAWNQLEYHWIAPLMAITYDPIKSIARENYLNYVPTNWESEPESDPELHDELQDKAAIEYDPAGQLYDALQFSMTKNFTDGRLGAIMGDGSRNPTIPQSPNRPINSSPSRQRSLSPLASSSPFAPFAPSSPLASSSPSSPLASSSPIMHGVKAAAAMSDPSAAARLGLSAAAARSGSAAARSGSSAASSRLSLTPRKGGRRTQARKRKSKRSNWLTQKRHAK